MIFPLVVLAALAGAVVTAPIEASEHREFRIVSFNGSGYQRDALEEGLREAARVLAQSERCRALFGKPDVFAYIQSFLDEGLIEVSSDYEARVDGYWRRVPFSSRGIGATTVFAHAHVRSLTQPGMMVSASRVTINAKGFYFTFQNENGDSVEKLRTAGLFLLTPRMIRGAVILHEMLHTAQVIPADGGDLRLSQANSEIVRRYCFL
jgi:hypothetical protein